MRELDEAPGLSHLASAVLCDNRLGLNLATFWRCIELPGAMADWSLTRLQLKLIEIGARVVRHARAITCQLAEVAMTGPMMRYPCRDPPTFSATSTRVTTVLIQTGRKRQDRFVRRDDPALRPNPTTGEHSAERS